MKQISQHLLVPPLLVAVALLLCFGSCQSSDNAGVGEGASVASLPLKAQIDEASSRVMMSDTYSGAFSCSWNSDQLNVYHPYVLNGAIQSMKSLPFSTGATNVSSATFSYTGTDGYRYNPGARLYAFSSNTSGGYTASVAPNGTSTLTATSLASQLGTLSDCAKYDALYGSSTVDFSTGKPGPLTMSHLFGMLNLHLTSSSFSTSYPVTVTLSSSAANILPGNSGTATLSADGSTLTRTGSWVTSWSKAITPTVNGVVDVYLMTWPFSGISGNLTVSCSDGTGNTYTGRTVTLSGYSLGAGKLKSNPLAITNAPAVIVTPDTYSKLYAWDATNSVPVTVGTVPTNANSITTASDLQNHASYACKNCPSYNEISWYLKAGCYWDDGTQGINGGNTIDYKTANNTTTKAGCWFKKKSAITTGFSSTTKSGVTSVSFGTSNTLSTMSVSAISALHLSTDYFFLPAVGYTGNTNGAFANGGTAGNYWSSTPTSNTSRASNLGFNSSSAYLNNYDRTYGFSLWQVQ